MDCDRLHLSGITDRNAKVLRVVEKSKMKADTAQPQHNRPVMTIPDTQTGQPGYPPEGPDFRVADWLVRPPHHQIRLITDSDRTRQLEPRLMKLLCLLADRPGEVLSRDELMEALWPRVVVNENSLTRAMSELRRHLQDGSDRQFIATIPKRGYKLVAPVSGAVASCEPGRTGTSTVHRDHGMMYRIRRYAMGLAAVNAVLAIGLLGLPVLAPLNGTPPGMPQNGDTTVVADRLPDTQRPWSDGDIMSTDGTRSRIPAISASRSTGGGSATNSSDIAISPDGELVAFTRMTDETSTLMIGSMDSPDSLQVYTSQHRIDHLYWSPVGNALLFSILPRVSHAAIDERESGRLMLFDLQELSVRKLHRSAHGPEETPARFNDALNLT